MTGAPTVPLLKSIDKMLGTIFFASVRLKSTTVAYAINYFRNMISSWRRRAHLIARIGIYMEGRGRKYFFK